MFYFHRKQLHYTLLLCILLLISGCTSISYYAQSIRGQFEVINKSQTIDNVVNNPDTDHELRDQLNTVLNIRSFSIEELGLPDNKSYLSYSDLKRDYVVWNIFATKEFSLEPIQSCFILVGCLDYRGFFSKEDAEAYAAKLAAQGMETYLGGVSAYSTLGWFNDPVLNTMLKWSEARLAAVIFHELTHQLFYIKGDTEFNESLADAIGIIGVRAWFKYSGQQDKLAAYEDYLEREDTFVQLVLKYKTLLEELYNKDISPDLMRQQKANIYQRMRKEYSEMSKHWQHDYYGNWIKYRLNNASMASVVSYRKYLSAFLELYKLGNEDIHQFYENVRTLLRCPQDQRAKILNFSIDDFSC